MPRRRPTRDDRRRESTVSRHVASKTAMIRCIEALAVPVDCVLTDAMPLELDIRCESIIKGDQKAAAIAAASIVAKVERDST